MRWLPPLFNGPESVGGIIGGGVDDGMPIVGGDSGFAGGDDNAFIGGGDIALKGGGDSAPLIISESGP